ncbi:CmcJ/NvfI family oxidoreductase [Denitrobaculum tricleocarpae]|uniref:Methyltransferase n=1 Tax=Denitrobaculum tricleocarpae TaxID=2591009 RepID=A0A545SXQ7_9PROT|nr:CmcJ/NvfI family oxidoreductase [Denitrobaculum tricleocarpae]TQV69743.1 hypothetical protein FKG95_28825 [Denitrobaculum tricleocarpae]
MQTTAIVNYHVRSDGPQAFQIDAGGEHGRLISPALAPTQVRLSDLRGGDVSASFSEDSLAILSYPSQVRDFGADESWREVYDRELRVLLERQVGAREVIVFDHTLRIDDPDSARKPARNVHSDYSPAGAHQRLRDLIGKEQAMEWEAGHFGFINIWRPVGNAINTAPLGFVRPASVKPRDWVEIGLIYPDRIGQIMGLVANDSHDWIYQSKMTPDEVACFNIYDNRGLSSIAHSALDRVENPALQVTRMSLESRTLVRY